MEIFFRIFLKKKFFFFKKKNSMVVSSSGILLLFLFSVMPWTYRRVWMRGERSAMRRRWPAVGQARRAVGLAAGKEFHRPGLKSSPSDRAFSSLERAFSDLWKKAIIRYTGQLEKEQWKISKKKIFKIFLKKKKKFSKIFFFPSFYDENWILHGKCIDNIESMRMKNFKALECVESLL